MNEEVNDLITYDELINAVELDDVNSNIRTAANYLIEALTDWPRDDFNQPVDLLIELSNEVNAALNYDNLFIYMTAVNTIKTNDNIWKGSAVSGLLELFDFNRTGIPDKTIILNDLFFTISKHYLNR